MPLVRKMLMVSIAASVLSGGVLAAEPKEVRASPAPGSVRYGVIESIETPPVQGDGKGASATDNATGKGVPGAETEKTRTSPARFVFRVRLDDGRYQGFHQPGGDELRVGDRVQIEADRLRRAQESRQVGK